MSDRKKQTCTTTGITEMKKNVVVQSAKTCTFTKKNYHYILRVY